MAWKIEAKDEVIIIDETSQFNPEESTENLNHDEEDIKIVFIEDDSEEFSSINVDSKDNKRSEEVDDLLQCPVCMQKMDTEKDTIRHLRTHLSLKSYQMSKPFKCISCNYAGYFKQNLDRHVSIVHENNKPFKCQDCHKRFSTKQNLNNHLKLHRDV
ncbi:hypothetical protein LAZ67_20000185 [Cordylochernes scorpioides]|uniref:C2H2-type domain-containing protein n=1 Tax=Cordylochernes scorpioides TaxID=51811 RepID=A0ABY6LKM6_9ARAC|nr:hypothetical protein LAZ67_20000185 [Cordylochernes scorpioides]